MKKTIPFKLDQLTSEYYFIEIFPKYEKFLAGISARSLSTASKLLAALQPLDKEETAWGLNLSKNYGLLVSERMSLKDTENRRKSIAEYLALLGKVHEETKLPIEELQEYFAEPFKHVDILKDYLGEISSVYSKLQDQNDQTELVSIMLKERLIPTWTIQDTKALHEKIYEDILKYAQGEQMNWEEDAVDPDSNEPMPGEAGGGSSSEGSANSVVTETPIGELSTTTLLTGV